MRFRLWMLDEAGYDDDMRMMEDGPCHVGYIKIDSHQNNMLNMYVNIFGGWLIQMPRSNMQKKL